ncbi:MAG: peptide ABC transporter substrate-binding protein [Actinobacteria bacterium]|nr:peptide ABC transporter substrate-binding protein [Actinomycetota bacterium]
MSSNDPGPSDWYSDLSRRHFLKLMAQSSAAVGGMAVLAGCGAAATSNGTSSSAGGGGGTPRKGGKLRIGMTGGGPSDTLDGQAGLLSPDFARASSLYNPLASWDVNAKATMILAESMEPDKTAKVWTVKLKPGIKFHDGKPLTADDVIFSINRVLKEETQGYFAVAPIEGSKMKKVDDLTVQLPMKYPYPQFIEYYCSLYQNLNILPTNYNVKKPVGTGPFKYVSFTPGQSSVFAANDEYFGEGPYVDELEITDFPDENSQINALLSGQVDGISLLSVASLPRLEGAGAVPVIAAETGTNTAFTMRVDQPPFNDVKVRQAMRLLVDREAMQNVIFGGKGSIGNDIFSPYDPLYDRSIPQREQDIEQAKSLLKSAGQEGLSVELTTADIFSGTLSAAQVFAQQAAGAGVDVKLNQLTTTDFFNNFLEWNFAQTFWYYTPYLAQVAQELLPTGPFNETHWNDPRYSKLYQEAFTTTDESLRTEIAHQMQEIDHEEGGLIIPYFLPIIDGVSTSVKGAQTSKTGFSFGNYNFAVMWLE